MELNPYLLFRGDFDGNTVYYFKGDIIIYKQEMFDEKYALCDEL